MPNNRKNFLFVKNISYENNFEQKPLYITIREIIAKLLNAKKSPFD